MNKMKGKNRIESESDESNQNAPNLDLSLIRQPIATSITGFEEVLRAFEAGTNEVSCYRPPLLSLIIDFYFFYLLSCENYYRENAT